MSPFYLSLSISCAVNIFVHFVQLMFLYILFFDEHFFICSPKVCPTHVLVQKHTKCVIFVIAAVHSFCLRQRELGLKIKAGRQNLRESVIDWGLGIILINKQGCCCFKYINGYHPFHQNIKNRFVIAEDNSNSSIET